VRSTSTILQVLSVSYRYTDLGAIHNIGAPIHVYPLYENALRAHRGQSPKANHEESAKLYAEFSQVAQENEYAWNQGKTIDEQDIARIDKNNRMICYPCETYFSLAFAQLTLYNQTPF
jgi:hypothetical protein